MTGERVVDAADAAEVAATLRLCARDGAAVVAVGGETLQSIGNAPRRCDVALRLGALRGIRDYDPREGTIGIDAGTTLAELARTLGADGQCIPFDAPLPERATVGGTLAAGWTGPRRAAYGRPRDLLIGSTVALADGTLARAGGMVVKNVSGYDMSKLYVGSLGTLGIIVRANFKTLPRAPAYRLALAPLAEDVADRAVAATGMTVPEPSAALVVEGFAGAAPPGSALRLAVLLEGSEAAVERGTRELRSALGRAGVAETRLLDGNEAERTFGAIVDAYVEILGERSLTYRSTGLPSSAWPRSRLAQALAAEFGLVAEAIADLRTGDAILRFGARDRAAFVTLATAFDAALRARIDRTTILAGGAAIRARLDAWDADPSTIETMRAIKARFDPRGILAPGRYVGAI